MIAANYTELRTNLKEYLDHVEAQNETLVIKRDTEDGVVIVSEKEFRLLTETVHQLKSRKNATHLYESLEQMK